MDTVAFESLERLQSLHRDLLNLTESRLPNIERLLFELEARVEDFRKLLDKPAKDEKSRQVLLSGSLQIAELEYTINEDFKQETIQLSDFLNLDEIEAAKLYLQAQEDARGLDRSPLASSVILFHQRRQFLLECLRLSFQRAFDPVGDQALVDPFLELSNLILQTDTGRPQLGAAYWRKCLTSMEDIEKWLHQVAERVQSLSVTGQAQSSELAEIMEYQNESLTRQHESLGAIAYHLIKANHTKTEDFRFLLSRLKTFDRYDAILVHYLPALTSSVVQFAPSANSIPTQEAKALQDVILATGEQDMWSLRSFQAAAKVIWLVEFTARFLAQEGFLHPPESENPGEIEGRSIAFMEALRDGAFQFMLCVSRDVKNDAWFDPLRHGITSFLTQDTPALQSDPFKTENYFHDILMLQFQGFATNYIGNMPDTLRKLKYEEDEQRRQTHGVVQLRSTEYELHLERFLIIIAYAYEGFPDTADEYWTDPDSNLFGFLQWASQRQSTPRVAAFCEMLMALSEDETCADSAHNFLLDEGSSIGGKSRKHSQLSWVHIFSELEFYSSTIREKPALQQGKSQIELVEPESAMMLECYLRLLSHLCKGSPKARSWILNHATFHVHEHLLLLCGSSIESRLRACAFTALAALLAGREREIRDAMWSALDAWISGPTSTINTSRPPMFQGSSAVNEQIIFDSLSTGFEEPNSFVELLQALIAPTSDENGLNDSLPFPEALGAAYRMPGIEPYVDFALGLFATKSFELQDPIQLRIMRLNCLHFAATCLSTFNDGLVLFANSTSISVDSAMRTSSLATYTRIHPFARVMEWFFNDRVITALFATAIQDIRAVNSAASDSPLILGLIRSIEVIDLVMVMQSTYFDIVRPIVKLQSTSRRLTVANSAIASFEDAILNNVSIVTSLGLYCGSGHQDLTICSIRLLERLSLSRKLTAPLTGVNKGLSKTSRLITALERNNEVESISRSLVSEMSFNVSEVEQGPTSPGLIIKEHLLRFINGCLETDSHRPTIAHVLLGFSCQSYRLGAAEGGLFAAGDSLFHAIVMFLVECPYGDAETIVSWLTSLKTQGIQILAKLWKSPMSSQLVLPELRVREFLFNQWLQQPSVGPDVPWEGRSIQEPDFFLAGSALAYANFLQQRRALFEYVATELRSAAIAGMATLQSRIRSTLLGSMTFLGGQQVQCLTIFDMVDFLKLDLNDSLPLPESRYFNIAELDMCRVEGRIPPRYNVQTVEQLLLLRQNELRQSAKVATPADEKQMQADAQNLVQCLHANNNRAEIQNARAGALASWVKLVIVVLETCDFDKVQLNSFISQGLQVILPRLERSYAEDITTSIILAQLGQAFIQRADLAFVSGGASVSADASNDKLIQLFRIALIGMQCPEATTTLREVCYLICHGYFYGICRSQKQSLLSRHALHCVKVIGDRLIEVICDDAYAGEGACRTSALLLLGAIVGSSNEQGSKDIIESLTRLNFVQVIVDGVRNIALELQATEDSVQLLLYYSASLALLLRISQTRLGATQVMNAGLFASIRESGLFSADPDLGLDVDNPRALTAYFNLLLSILRIIDAIVLSRGNQNDQTIAQAREFLHEYRPSIMAIFKRNAKIGIAGDVSRVTVENEGTLGELVDGFTVLIDACWFLAVEQETSKRTSAGQLFT